MKIASEIASNATRRLGHTLVVALEALNGATPERFDEDSRYARGILEAAVMNEKETLASVLELAPGVASLSAHVARLAKAVDGVGASGLAALESHRTAVAQKLGAQARPYHRLRTWRRERPRSFPGRRPRSVRTATGDTRSC